MACSNSFEHVSPSVHYIPRVPQYHRKALQRFESPTHARFLTFSCIHNQPFLRSSRTCEWLASAIDAAHTCHHFELWAFVFMPTQVHLVVLCRSPVPDLLKSVKQSVSRKAVRWARHSSPQTLERMRDGSGAFRFWQRGGGYDRNIWTTAHIWDATDYIHRNPVEAKLCESPFDWRWSSASQHDQRGKPGCPVVHTESLPPRP